MEREQVDSIQPKLHHMNAVGQGLIQSAAKHTDTQALEHDLETTNLQWNSLNKRVRHALLTYVTDLLQHFLFLFVCLGLWLFSYEYLEHALNFIVPYAKSAVSFISELKFT